MARPRRKRDNTCRRRCSRKRKLMRLAGRGRVHDSFVNNLIRIQNRWRHISCDVDCRVTHAARSIVDDISTGAVRCRLKVHYHGRDAGCVWLKTTSLCAVRRSSGAEDKKIIFHFCVSVSVATLIIHNDFRRNISQSGSLRAWRKT